MPPGGATGNSGQFGIDLWTDARCTSALKSFHKNNDSCVATQREFPKKFGIHQNSKVPSAHAIEAWVNNFEETGSAVTMKGGSIQNFKIVSTPQNTNAMRASF
jgi:hypothetical protein